MCVWVNVYWPDHSKWSELLLIHLSVKQKQNIKGKKIYYANTKPYYLLQSSKLGMGKRVSERQEVPNWIFYLNKGNKINLCLIMWLWINNYIISNICQICYINLNDIKYLGSF